MPKFPDYLPLFRYSSDISCLRDWHQNDHPAANQATHLFRIHSDIKMLAVRFYSLYFIVSSSSTSKTVKALFILSNFPLLSILDSIK